MTIKDFIQNFREQPLWKKGLFLLAMTLLLLAAVLDRQQIPPVKKTPQATDIRLDQMTPPGHSLFPLNPLNSEALSNVMGVTGKVALYESNSSRLIIDNLKLIRSQEDHQTFIALVPDPLIPHLIQFNGKFLAVLKNPTQQSGTNFVSKKRTHKRPVYYGVEQL